MGYSVLPLVKADAEAMAALMRACGESGEVLYKPLSAEEIAARFFADNCTGFAAKDENGKLIGFAQAAFKTTFLRGETHENTPLYLTMIMVNRDRRGEGVGKALLTAVREACIGMGKKSVVISNDNPIHLTWLIPGANGHDHNNCPGAWEDGASYGWFIQNGFHDDYHEISLYINLKDFKWDEHLDESIAKLAEEGIEVGRWRIELGDEYDEMCDRVGSEYWRNVLNKEIDAWKENRANDDPELWADADNPPKAPRIMLTATKDGHIIGFTGPVDLQKSGRGWFTGICTDPAWGGRGIATILFNMLMREFVEEGAAFSSLFTGVTNHAQKIYLRAGLTVRARFAALSLPLDGDKFEHKYF